MGDNLSGAQPATILEKVATAASITCAVECTARPFALLLLPLVGVAIAEAEWVEFLLLLMLVVFGGWNLLMAVRRGRNVRKHAVLFVLGSAALLAAHFIIGEGSVAGVAVAVAGAAAVAWSQAANLIAARCTQ